MNPILVLFIVCLISYLFYRYATGKPDNSPPGIWRLPIWGSYWILLWGNYKFPHNTIYYYMKKFNSKIISCWLGDFFTVIVNDYASIKEVFSRKEFDGRLIENPILILRTLGKNTGIFFNDGPEWLEQRRFSLRNLRDFGFGRRFKALENAFADELSTLVTTIQDGPISKVERKVVNGDMVLFPDILFPSTVNTIWYTMSGLRFDRAQHETCYKLAHGAHRFQKGGDTSGGAIGITPWLRHFGNLFGWSDFIGGNQIMVDFIKNYIDQVKHEDLDNRTHDGFIPAYLREMKKLNGENEAFSEHQLIMIVVDFIFPAISAVPSVVTHAIKFMIHYPDVRKRVQEEIDSIVGRERLPEWDDRKNLPYTEATLKEVMRVETLTPLGVAHRCTEPTILQNYTIPANTILITNLSAMNNDPSFWGDPEVFRPDRFLTKDLNQLDKDWTLPFGLGRRVCAGETFARFVLFGLFATLLARFDFELVKGQPLGLDDKIPGIIVQPKKAWVRVVPR